MKAIYQQNPIIPKIFLGINLFFLLIWGYAKSFDVYKFILTGAFYELVWLPTLFAFFAAFFGLLFFWIKDALRLNSVYFYLFGFSVVLLILLFGFS